MGLSNNRDHQGSGERYIFYGGSGGIHKSSTFGSSDANSRRRFPEIKALKALIDRVNNQSTESATGRSFLVNVTRLEFLLVCYCVYKNKSAKCEVTNC